MKHTPGPWKVIADPYEDGTPYFRFAAGDAHSGDSTTMGFHFAAIVREADARLIVAAPGLLSALRMARAELAPRRSFVDMPRREVDTQYVRDQIDAAITRATQE